MRRADFIDTNEYGEQELTELMNLAIALKACAKAGYYPRLIKNSIVAVVSDEPEPFFEAACVTAIRRLGGAANLIHCPLDVKSVKAAARRLGGIADCILVRAKAHESVLALHRYAGVAVVNGGSAFNMPVQELADLVTMYENLPKEKRLEECKLIYAGPASADCASSLFLCSKMGLSFVQVAATAEQLKPQALKIGERNIKKSGGAFLVTDNPLEGFRDADFVKNPDGRLPEEASLAEKPPVLLPPEENLLSALRAALLVALYQDPAERDALLVEKMRRTLTVKLHAVFGFGEAE